jgi:hypothetical protein
MLTRITTLTQLKKEARDEQNAEFFILLKGYFRSSKRITWDDDNKRFFIFNFIDDTKQVLTEEQLMDREYTNIGYAITKGALYKDD